MRRLVTLVLAALALAAPAVEVSAEEINFATLTAERPNVVEARTGLDHAFVLELGYRRVVEWRGRQLLFGGDWAFPWASPDFGDFRVRATASASLLRGSGSGWKLVASLSPTLRATQNAAADMHALGADVRLTGGYYRRWWCAGEVGLDWAATTHVSHSGAYRETVYADARDGWYTSPGGTFYAGGNAGVSIKSVDVMLRVGHPRSLDLAQQTVPFFVLVGVNVALPR